MSGKYKSWTVVYLVRRNLLTVKNICPNVYAFGEDKLLDHCGFKKSRQ